MPSAKKKIKQTEKKKRNALKNQLPLGPATHSTGKQPVSPGRAGHTLFTPLKLMPNHEQLLPSSSLSKEGQPCTSHRALLAARRDKMGEKLNLGKSREDRAQEHGDTFCTGLFGG